MQCGLVFELYEIGTLVTCSYLYTVIYDTCWLVLEAPYFDASVIYVEKVSSQDIRDGIVLRES